MSTTVTIELKLNCDSELAFDVVDAVLDNGTLQDAIVEYAEFVGRGTVLVLNASVGQVATVYEPKKTRKSTRRKGA